MPIKISILIRNTFYLLSLTFIFLYIFAESNYIQNKNLLYVNASLSELMISSIGLVLMLWAMPTKSRLKWLKVSLIMLKSSLIFTALFLVFAEAAMVDFSGMLFGPEAIVHFSWDALILGVNEYLWLFCALLLFLALAVFILVYSSQTWLSNKAQWWVFISSILLLSYAFDHSVLGRYTQGIKRYIDLNELQAVNAKQVEKLKPLGIKTLTANKSEIIAHASNHKNLVVIYLESFSEIFTTSNQYPNLTPNINRLKVEHESISPYISTAKFTMDGLIGSLCGFLPNMTLGNNALTDSEKHYYLIPCMSDVLKKAGYHQEFLGGAKKSFANKGTFLLDHGYDQVFGWEDFEKQKSIETPVRKNWWGLHDDDLFSFAETRIKALKNQDKPFHISLLTIATHLKGFAAPSCLPYTNDADRFIDAIHCTDQLLGQFINHLQKADLLKDTVVFITGDHGVFNTSLTKDLFGDELRSHHILGIIIDKTPKNNNVPMGLYDMAPVLLDRLEIKHNVTFINGQSSAFSSERLFLTRNEAYQNGEPIKLNPVCEKDDDLDPNKLSVCTHSKSINTLHGYTQLFKLDKSLKYQSESALKITLSEDKKKVLEITLNGKSIKNSFTRNGFKLDGNNFSSAEIFYLQFDPVNKTINKTFLLDTTRKPFNGINYLTTLSDFPYLVFSLSQGFEAAFKENLNQHEPSGCLNDRFCYYQLDKLGSFEQNSQHNEVTLIFNK